MTLVDIEGRAGFQNKIRKIGPPSKNQSSDSVRFSVAKGARFSHTTILDQAIGRRAAFIRHQHKLSARQVAHLLSVTRQYLRDVESGQARMTMKTMFRLCKLYDVSPRRFCAGIHHIA